MNNKPKLTLGSKCESCGRNHNPPLDIMDNIKWNLELTDGYHSSGCCDSNNAKYHREILVKLLEVFDQYSKEHLPILPSNVSREAFMEVEQEVMKILKNTKKRTI